MSTGINGIKISELDKSTDLTNTQILSSYIPIVVGDKNYKMQFSERLYSISEIENKLSTLELKILEISSDNDDSDGKLILERLENFDKHISGLIDGPFVLNETSDIEE